MGVKFEHDGEPRAIWFSIEQTTQERRNAARVSGIVRGLVKHLVEVGKKNEVNAKQHIDSDYKRGVIVFKELPVCIDVDDNADRPQRMKRTRIIQKGYFTGVLRS